MFRPDDDSGTESPFEFDRWFAVRAGDAEIPMVCASWLFLPTGRLVVTDPIGGDPYEDVAPFDRTVRPGRYRVEVLVTPTGVAAARLIVAPARSVSWERATAKGDLGGDCVVNAGTCCFADEETVRHGGVRHDADRQLTLLQDLASEGPGLVAVPGSELGGADGDIRDENVMVAFSAGEGDGVYTTWIGRTARGGVTCFVIDFTRRSDRA